jgi:hypothetical protein
VAVRYIHIKKGEESKQLHTDAIFSTSNGLKLQKVVYSCISPIAKALAFLSLPIFLSLAVSRRQKCVCVCVCVCVEEEDNCSSCFVHNFKWAVESLSLATGSDKFTPAAKSHGTNCSLYICIVIRQHFSM